MSSNDTFCPIQFNIKTPRHGSFLCDILDQISTHISYIYMYIFVYKMMYHKSCGYILSYISPDSTKRPCNPTPSNHQNWRYRNEIFLWLNWLYWVLVAAKGRVFCNATIIYWIKVYGCETSIRRPGKFALSYMPLYSNIVYESVTLATAIQTPWH